MYTHISTKLNSKDLKNSKIKGILPVSPSFYFYLNEKKLSKKENFYQYLFIQQIVNDNFSFVLLENKINWTENKKFNLNSNLISTLFQTTLKSKNIVNTPIKSFLNIAHHIPISCLSENVLINKTNTENVINYKKKYKNFNPKLFFQDKIFITYKKSFLCYWLLPFLGLTCTTNPTILQSFLTPIQKQNFNEFSSVILKSSPNNLKLNSNNVTIENYKKINEIRAFLNSNFSGFNISNSTKEYNNQIKNNPNIISNNSPKNLYSILLSSNPQTLNNNLFTCNNSKGIQSENVVLQSQSILLTAFNIYKNGKIPSILTSKEIVSNLEEKMLLSDLSFSKINSYKYLLTRSAIPILNRNLKVRSNFKWYWFLLQTNSNDFSHNSITNFSKDFTKLKPLFDKKVYDSSNNLTSKQATYFPNKIIIKNILNPLENLNNSSAIFSNSNIVKKTIANLYNSSVNSKISSGYNLVKSTNFKQTEKIFQDKKLKNSVVEDALKENNYLNDYLIGVIKKDVVLNLKSSFKSNRKISTSKLTNLKVDSPSKSLKKAAFIMTNNDYAALNLKDNNLKSVILTSKKLLKSPQFISNVSKLNLDLKFNLEKWEPNSSLLYFKDKSKIFKTNSNLIQSILLIFKNSFCETSDRTEGFFVATENDILYNCIFEGLKYSLEDIINSRINDKLSAVSAKQLRNFNFDFMKTKKEELFIKKFNFIFSNNNIDKIVNKKIQQNLNNNLNKSESIYNLKTNSLNLITFFKNKKYQILNDQKFNIPINTNTPNFSISILNKNSKYKNYFNSERKDLNSKSLLRNSVVKNNQGSFLIASQFNFVPNKLINTNSSSLSLINEKYKNSFPLNIISLKQPIKGGNLSLSAFINSKAINNNYLTSNLNYSFPGKGINIINKNNTIEASFLNLKNNLNKKLSSNNLNKEKYATSLLNESQKQFFNKNQDLEKINLSKEQSKILLLRNDKIFSQAINKKYNSFLFLNNYINLITNTIAFQLKLSPYKLRLTYLPEININSSNIIPSELITDNSRKFIFYKPENYPKNEKIFLSYLSKSKKPQLSSFLNNLTKKSFTNLTNSSLTKKYFVSKKIVKFINNKIKFKELKTMRVSFNNTILNLKRKNLISDKFNNNLGLFLSTDRLLIQKNLNISNRNILNYDNSMLLKNRLFLNKELTPKMKKADFDILKEERFREKQHQKIKRRLKKMKKETRRRKKRKIFYPRPNWITFSIYKKFLNNRYLKNQLLFKTKMNTTYSNLFPNYLSFVKKMSIKPKYKTNVKIKSESLVAYNKFKNVNTIFKSLKRKNSLKNNYLKNTEISYLNYKNTKDFYRISSTVFADLRRVLLKSNYLKNYLNPYLEKIKNIYKHMQKSSRKMDLYLNLRSVILFIYYGNTQKFNIFPIQKNMNSNGYGMENNKNYNLNNIPNSKLPIYLNLREALLYQTENTKFLTTNFQKIQFNNNKLDKINKKNFRQNAINILEYNKIIYQRLQRVILNIRENLNLNGQIKNRSKKLGKNLRAFIKREYTKRNPERDNPTGNQNVALWSKILKNDIVKFGQTFVTNGYDIYGTSYNNVAQFLSRNNFYWALNKSSTFYSNANYNSSYVKKLWETYKIREISKNNKTKKIIFNIIKKLTSISQPTNSLDGYIHVLHRNTNNIKYLKIKDSYNINQNKSRKESLNIVSENIKNKNSKNYFIEETMGTEDKKLINLPINLYITKSEQKLINIENKLKNLGLYSKKLKNSYKNAYFRFLKQQLLKEKNVSPFKNSNDFLINIKQKSLNNIAGRNLFKNQEAGILNNYTTFSNNFSYWWSFLKINKIDPIQNKNNKELSNYKIFKNNSSMETQFDLKEKNEKKSNLFINPFEISFYLLSPLTLSSFLFHFCALVSFISLGGVRTLIKFYYLLISKISYLISKIELIGKQKKIKSKDTTIFIKKDKNTYSPNFNSSFIIEKNLISLIPQMNSFKKEPRFFFKSITKNFLTIKYLKLSFLKYLTPELMPNTILKLKDKKYLTSTINKNILHYKDVSKNKLLNNSLLNDFNELINLISLSKIVKSNNKRETIQNDKRGVNKNSKFFISANTKNFTQIFYKNLKPLNFKLSKNTDKYIELNKSRTNEIKIIYFSFLKILSTRMRFMYKTSFYFYLLLLKSLDILAIPASLIYKFFEKPGEYVVENLAYSFLLEWSSDLISTIPDTVDNTQALYFNKMNRNISPLMLMNINNVGSGFLSEPLSLLNMKLPMFFLDKYVGISELSHAFLFGISNNVLKRLLNSSFLIFIQQLNEPDLDYINRKKKGIIFWDIWGEHLKTIAEDNSINIYELTNDKEEQVKLLSKYQETVFKQVNSIKTTSYIDKNNKFQINLNKKLLNLINPAFVLGNDKKENLKFNKNSTTNYLIENLVKESKTTNSHYYGWSVSQFLSYQGKDSDLFIQSSPASKSFLVSAASLSTSAKYSVQQPIGSIVCQIFSGIFYKQISKNILVIGSSGLEKSLLIQAIAGETELKIITDNAHRYAMVYRGVAVGIKLLRDVFEALSLHTPCIFLLEDIHAIGERRPFLIDEASPSAAVSELYNKNQSMQGLFLKEKSSASREVLYKNNKHLLNHYKKPYKEPRNLASNHFSFTFLFGDLNAKIRNNDIKAASASLSIQIIKKENESKLTNIKKSYGIGEEQNVTYGSTKKNINKQNKTNVYSSILEIQSSNQELLTPPASSPFSVLLLKEATKFKHKKIVKEMPWFGLPGEQFSLVSKYNYSIRVKIALLADLVLSNLSVKLDMITDLLVIIDSVKGNRGFVVFATTHIPYILDPALRRPGRFDETISLPLIPTLYSRWVNYRYNIQYLTTSLFKKYSIPLNYTFNKGTTLDLSQSNLIHNLNREIINYLTIQNSSLGLLATEKTQVNPIFLKYLDINLLKSERNYSFKKVINKKSHIKKNQDSFLQQILFNKNLSNNSKRLIKGSWKHLFKILQNSKNSSNGVFDEFDLKSSKSNFLLDSIIVKSNNFVTNNQLIPLYKSDINSNIFSVNSTIKYLASLDNFKKRKHFMQNYFINNKNSHQKNNNNIITGLETLQTKNKSLFFSNKKLLQLKTRNYSYACKALSSLIVYSGYNYSFLSSHNIFTNQNKNKNSLGSLQWPSFLKDSTVSLDNYSNYLTLFNSDKAIFKLILIIAIASKLGETFASTNTIKIKEQKYKTSLFNSPSNTFLFNFDKTWKYGFSLLFNYIQKSQCSIFNKNLAISSTKLLSFNNKYSLMEAPSPPISNILLPAKRYENYKRTFNNYYSTLINSNNFNSSISQKIELHQQQRLLKRLYKYPIKEFFRSHLLKGDKTISNFNNFNNSYLVLAPLEKINLVSLNKLSSVNWCYRNIIYNRHKTYLTNQWWNAQQGEHNAETTFLSDIDWRYTFVQSIGDIQIDFPDSEQFYNPRNRRWILTNGDWNYWFNIEAEIKDIYSHFVYECFTKAYKYLDQNREIIDFYAEILHQTPLTTNIKERNLLNLYKRFL